MRVYSFLIPSAVVLAVAGIVFWAVRSPASRTAPMISDRPHDDVADVTAQVNRHFQTRWDEEHITPAETADALQILRRISLALHGTIPSLEEIRSFEADHGEHRLDRWTASMLDDNRFADYFSERLARSYVGTDGGQFIVYRRDRFVQWLADELKRNRPYDEIVRQIITQRGLWTGQPATNFVTATVLEGDIDENKLAGRCVRAFLGQRIDCAQCHDHPFAKWKQSQFEGLAAYFAHTKLSVFGLEDKATDGDKQIEYEIIDRDTQEKRVVASNVPFGSEWLPQTGTRREQLAAWITHPKNRRFDRAIVNRVWGLMFGRPYIDPVDDLPDPGDPHQPDLLDILGKDFREHGCDLRRLILVIAASQPFRLDSRSSQDRDVETSEERITADKAIDRLTSNWAVFQLTRLRPEQVIGVMLQAGSIRTVDSNSHLIVRTIRFFRENDFINEYGDLGEDELDKHAGTIPQALLRMNGNLSSEIGSASPMTAAGRIIAIAENDRKCLEVCFLVCATRRPTPEQQEYFLDQLHGTSGEIRKQVVEDIMWSLFNSEAFSW
ncbi:MAG: DUF1549 domain-containing protein, partial [Planctomycetes bacterium]|nr:DUF1549 domain-containing protein [Planctomycetota bacterium]